MWDFRRATYAMTQLAKADLSVSKLLERLRKDGADTWLTLWSTTLKQLKERIQLTEAIMTINTFFFKLKFF